MSHRRTPSRRTLVRPRPPAPPSRPSASALLAAVLGAEPGAQMLAQIAGLDPAGLDPDGRLLLVQALEHQARWLAAVSARALAAVSGPAWLGDRADEWAGDEVAAALQLSPGTAAIRLMQARQLAGPLAATRAALAAGEISALHARALAEATLAQTDDQAGAVQAAVLPVAAGLTLARFRRAIERATIELDPAGAAQRRDEAVAGRRVDDYPEPNGMVRVAAVLPAEGAALVMTALDAGAARYGADDERGIDARRADVLLGWAAAALDDPTRGRDIPVRHAVAVTVDLATLLGLAECPAELAGYGRSRPRSPGRWLPTPTGAGSSPTRSPAPCSTTAAGPTPRRRRWPPSSGPGTRSVGSRAARCRPGAATSTMCCPGPPAASPGRPTWRRCAAGTIGPRPPAAGGSDCTPTPT